MDVSVNWTESGAMPDIGVAVKEAIGRTDATELTVIVCVYEFAPMELVAVRVTI